MIWFAITTRTGREIEAARDLNEVGGGVYLPIRWKLRKPSRNAYRLAREPVALFPGYLFALASTPGHLGALLAGVQRLPWGGEPVRAVAVQGSPIAIGEHTIDEVRRAESSRVFDDNEAAPPIIIRLGQSITISSGPLDGRTGKVVEINRKSLQVEIEGRAVTVRRAMVGG